MARENAQRPGGEDAERARLDPLSTPRNCIALATAAELPFVIDLQKKFSNQIGFLPKVGLAWYVEHSHVWMSIQNGEPSGYILGRPSLRFNRLIAPVFQAAVAMDAQRRKNGLALLHAIEVQARSRAQQAIQANCRSDLEANEFWKAAGFVPVGILEATTARGISRICWRKCLALAEPTWFNDLPPVAGFKAKRTHAQPTFATLFNKKEP